MGNTFYGTINSPGDEIPERDILKIIYDDMRVLYSLKHERGKILSSVVGLVLY